MPVATSPDGLRIAYERRGDPRFVFLHANGFCKEVWHPVVEAIGDVGIVSIDQPGHGASDAPDPPFDWWDFGRGVLAVVDEVGGDGLVGVGHASGGGILVIAEILRPGTFDRLVLVEPVIPPPPYGRMESHPLIDGALKRRTVFDSAEAAFAAYHGRGPVARWDDRALRAYVEHGFARTSEGWELRCSPEVEAEFYRTAETHGAWERLDEVRCPVDLVVGADSDTHDDEDARRLASRFPEVTLRVVDEATHFVPMECPEEVARIVLGG